MAVNSIGGFVTLGWEGVMTSIFKNLPECARTCYTPDVQQGLTTDSKTWVATHICSIAGITGLSTQWMDCVSSTCPFDNQEFILDYGRGIVEQVRQVYFSLIDAGETQAGAPDACTQCLLPTACPTTSNGIYSCSNNKCILACADGFFLANAAGDGTSDGRTVGNQCRQMIPVENILLDLITGVDSSSASEQTTTTVTTSNSTNTPTRDFTTSATVDSSSPNSVTTSSESTSDSASPTSTDSTTESSTTPVETATSDSSTTTDETSATDSVTTTSDTATTAVSSTTDISSASDSVSTASTDSATTITESSDSTTTTTTTTLPTPIPTALTCKAVGLPAIAQPQDNLIVVEAAYSATIGISCIADCASNSSEVCTNSTLFKSCFKSHCTSETDLDRANTLYCTAKLLCPFTTADAPTALVDDAASGLPSEAVIASATNASTEIRDAVVKATTVDFASAQTVTASVNVNAASGFKMAVDGGLIPRYTSATQSAVVLQSQSVLLDVVYGAGFGVHVGNVSTLRVDANTLVFVVTTPPSVTQLWYLFALDSSGETLTVSANFNTRVVGAFVVSLSSSNSKRRAAQSIHVDFTQVRSQATDGTPATETTTESSTTPVETATSDSSTTTDETSATDSVTTTSDT
ncbi:UNVERIFIED_CONTAM: hypothetical protein HDU68_004245, partial [Siphonaria sp. JEL0065]